MMGETIVVTGSNGFIGSNLVEYLLRKTDYRVIGFSKGECRLRSQSNYTYFDIDLTNEIAITELFTQLKPEIIVHCAAISQVDVCEKDPELCKKVNVDATQFLVTESNKVTAQFIFLSSDFVFDGKDKWVTDKTVPDPISEYGKSKLLAEEVVKSNIEKWAIIRPVLVYGFSKSASRGNILTWVIDSLNNKKDINVVEDQIRTPTFVMDVVELISEIIDNSAQGYFNIGGSEAISVLDFAKQIANISCLNQHFIHPVKSKELLGADLRPIHSCFNSSRIKDEFNLNPVGVNLGIALSLEQL